MRSGIQRAGVSEYRRRQQDRSKNGRFKNRCKNKLHFSLQINILCIIYVCLCISSILLLIIFLDQRRANVRGAMSVMIRNSTKLLVSTVKHMRHINQLLLILISIWSGLELTFVFTIFTKASVRYPSVHTTRSCHRLGVHFMHSQPEIRRLDHDRLWNVRFHRQFRLR